MHSDSLDLHIIIHSRCFITFALRKCTIYMGIHMFNMHNFPFCTFSVAEDEVVWPPSVLDQALLIHLSSTRGRAHIPPPNPAILTQAEQFQAAFQNEANPSPIKFAGVFFFFLLEINAGQKWYNDCPKSWTVTEKQFSPSPGWSACSMDISSVMTLETRGLQNSHCPAAPKRTSEHCCIKVLILSGKSAPQPWGLWYKCQGKHVYLINSLRE